MTAKWRYKKIFGHEYWINQFVMIRSDILDSCIVWDIYVKDEKWEWQHHFNLFMPAFRYANEHFDILSTVKEYCNDN